jgi:hypothetical protein
MASSYSTDLKLELMVTGENSGTWGDKTNTNWNLIQQAVSGYQAVSIAGGAQTTALAMSNATLSNARNNVISLTGTITGNQIVTIPDGINKSYIVINNTTGAFTVQFKTVSGTGFTWGTTDKSARSLYADGTNITDVGFVSLTGVQTLQNKTLDSTNTANTVTLNTPKILDTGSIIDANSNAYVKFSQTASAVNQITVANSATGNNPVFSGTGTDNDVGINFTPKGVGAITFNGTGKIQQLKEKITVTAVASTGTINYDLLTQAVLYYTTTATGQFTVNFRGSSSTALNTMLNIGESMTGAFLNTNSTFYTTFVTVDGTSTNVTTKWQGGSAPSSGNSGIDTYSFTVIKTAASTYTILASQTQFN